MLPYRRAQVGIAELKAAIYELLREGPIEGMTGAQVGLSLGLHHGPAGHEGDLSRSLLAMMESDGVVEQEPTSKRWSLREHVNGETDEDVGPL